MPDLSLQIQNGMKWLDEQLPDWEMFVNIDDLDMSIGHNCVLGQLYGSFIGKVHEMFPESKWSPGMDDEQRQNWRNAIARTQDWLVTHGFDGWHNAALTVQWREAIQKRRSAAVPG